MLCTIVLVSSPTPVSGSRYAFNALFEGDLLNVFEQGRPRSSLFGSIQLPTVTFLDGTGIMKAGVLNFESLRFFLFLKVSVSNSVLLLSICF